MNSNKIATLSGFTQKRKTLAANKAKRDQNKRKCEAYQKYVCKKKPRIDQGRQIIMTRKRYKDENEKPAVRKRCSGVEVQKKKKSPKKQAFWIKFYSDLDIQTGPIITRNMSHHYEAWVKILHKSSEGRFSNLKEDAQFPTWYHKHGVITRSIAKKVNIPRSPTLPTPAKKDQSACRAAGDSLKTSNGVTKDNQFSVNVQPMPPTPLTNTFRPMMTSSRKLHLRRKVLSYMCQGNVDWSLWSGGDSVSIPAETEPCQDAGSCDDVMQHSSTVQNKACQVPGDNPVTQNINYAAAYKLDESVQVDMLKKSDAATKNFSGSNSLENKDFKSYYLDPYYYYIKNLDEKSWLEPTSQDHEDCVLPCVEDLCVNDSMLDVDPSSKSVFTINEKRENAASTFEAYNKRNSAMVFKSAGFKFIGVSNAPQNTTVIPKTENTVPGKGFQPKSPALKQTVNCEENSTLELCKTTLEQKNVESSRMVDGHNQQVLLKETVAHTSSEGRSIQCQKPGFERSPLRIRSSISQPKVECDNGTSRTAKREIPVNIPINQILEKAKKSYTESVIGSNLPDEKNTQEKLCIFSNRPCAAGGTVPPSFLPTFCHKCSENVTSDGSCLQIRSALRKVNPGPDQRVKESGMRTERTVNVLRSSRDVRHRQQMRSTN